MADFNRNSELSGLVIALAVLFVCGVGAAQNNEKKQTDGNSSAKQTRDASNGAVINNQPNQPVESTSKPKKNESGDGDALSRKDEYGLAISLALLLVVVMQVFIARRSTAIYDQQRAIMQKQVEAIETTERAYVGIAKMEMFISGDEPRLEITWVNGGKTPAWHFRCVPSLNIGEKPEPKGFLMDDDFSDIRNSFIPASAERLVSYTDLGICLSNEVLAQLMGSASRRLYAVMKGSYRDVKWKLCDFEYWALYMPHPFTPYFVELESDYEKKHANPA